MRAFQQVAVPHEDVVAGRLTMDVFAADLWQVVKGTAPEDYKDPGIFFRKTYLTRGLQNILDIAKKRLEGSTGDSVIQLQTPFGGGKTHTLIALYHKAKEWGVNVAVFEGTTFDPKEVKPWEEIEKQLTGKVELTRGDIAPGKEKLIKLISENSPVLILMDEVLEYVTKAAGVKVGDTNLASQTLAFVQELTGAVSTVGNSLLVITLPSSVLEHYDENAERFFQQLQKVTGRTERIYTPVEEDEIELVIRRRLFQSIKEDEAKATVDEFVDTAVREGLLKADERSTYRERFLKSYPFKPEVIDVLYKRWGSFPTFQRTRGVLRLLSLVVHDLLGKEVPYIRVSDFNLKKEEIKRELIKHIGAEWDSVIAQDITSTESGSKAVDTSIGASYLPYRLGTAVSTAIFMYSFSGRGERGTSIREIKLSTFIPGVPASIIDTAVNQLRERLFYLSDEGLYFTTQPNLNRIALLKEENITFHDIEERERELIEEHISKETPLKIHLWTDPKDIPDTPELKLIITRKKPIREDLETKGETPRVYRNTLVFLAGNENQEDTFHSFIRKLLAYQAVYSDSSLNLTQGQRKELQTKIKSYTERAYEELRKYYRKLFIPAKEGFREIDLGLPTLGEGYIDKEVYTRLIEEEIVLKTIDPRVLIERYMSNKDFVETKILYEAMLKTPGEIRPASKEVFIKAVGKGVSEGIFGLGIKAEDDKFECKYYRQSVNPELSENEVIIKPEFCKSKEEKTYTEESKSQTVDTSSVLSSSTGAITYTYKSSDNIEYISSLHLKFTLPVDKVSYFAQMVRFLNEKFSKCEIEICLKGEGGKITKNEYENKIKETLNQLDIDYKEELS